MADELAGLLPGRNVRCKGEDLLILPLYFGQYPRAIKLVRPLANALNESRVFAMSQVDGQVKFEISGNWMASLPMLLDEGGEALIMFFAYCINKPREWFNTLPGDEGLALAQAILAENADFFVQKILPMLNAMGLAKAASQDPAGAPLSLDSQATGTAGPTSSE